MLSLYNECYFILKYLLKFLVKHVSFYLSSIFIKLSNRKQKKGTLLVITNVINRPTNTLFIFMQYIQSLSSMDILQYRQNSIIAVVMCVDQNFMKPIDLADRFYQAVVTILRQCVIYNVHLLQHLFDMKVLHWHHMLNVIF